MRHSPFCPEIHGSSGLDSQHGGHLFGNSSPSRAPVQGKAVNVIFSRLAGEFMRSGRRRTRLVCTAPLTNCAVLLLVYPEVREMIEIVTMGGCLGIGNTGPVMEFNIQSDPEAAKIVFQSGVPLTMVPLEVTHTALVTDMVLKRIVTDKPSPFRRMLGDLVTFFAQTYKQVFQFDHPPLHDPCAVAAVIDPGIFQVKVMHVDIETCSLLSPGQTVCDIWGQSGKPANCGVAMTMDVAKFWNLVLDGVAAADRVSPLNEGN
ncbi:unnamed protein product [Ostreobium quekettii]|uniref:Inosine/uridine-preferring nucleoside hydrolase domain-containing protein n=1 Tax=Ostreobium quekettii TaxID=121088 RepID=A0A8S1IXR8_9CHLO|nr:unnamed protein product [Ostreobium quekettii]